VDGKDTWLTGRRIDPARGFWLRVSIHRIMNECQPLDYFEKLGEKIYHSTNLGRSQ
jgi:hypothetical protein